MKKKSINAKRSLFLAVCLSLLFLTPYVYASVGIFADMVESTEGIGNFVGELTYTHLTDTTATFSLSLTNTSNSSNGGFITAFAFNNPFNYITGGTLPSTNYSTFNLLGLSNTGIMAPPFGNFDIGAGTSNRFLGGGKASKGIGVGETGTFLFSLSGFNLNTLTEWDFVNTLSEKKTQTIIDPKQPAFFCVRFRGFNDGESDKVPGNVVPEPASIMLLGLGLLGFGIARKRRKI